MILTESSPMAQIPTLEPFDCDGDPNTLSSRWIKWIRALDIYFLAADVQESVQKRASLLHTGGLPLQELYYNIPGAHIEPPPDADIDVYKVAVNKLTEYFSTKQSFVYERHLFRLIKQDCGEKFEKFLLRLRHQATRCNFDKAIDDHLIDQIAEKCSSSELRKKILILVDTITVDKIVAEANSIKTIERQLIAFSKKTDLSVNKVDFKLRNNFQPQNTFQSQNTFKPKGEPCTSCGNKFHKSDYKSCPAIGKICTKYGRKGYFRKQCRTKAAKRLLPVSTQAPPTKKSRTEKNDGRLHIPYR